MVQESKNIGLQYEASSLEEQASNLEDINEDLKFECDKRIKDALL